jgi:hypothetical protein
MTEVLLQEDTGGVRVLTLNRPGVRNRGQMKGQDRA